MSRTARPRHLRYGLVPLTILAGMAFRLAFGPAVGADVLLLLLWPAVLLCAWYGGLGPGLSATLLAAACSLLAPGDPVAVAQPPAAARLALFVSAGFAVSLLCERLHRLTHPAPQGERRLDDTLASIEDAVITVDTAGRVTFMNRAAQSLTGWPVGEAVGQPFEAVVRVVEEPLWTPFQPQSDTVLQAETAAEPAIAPVLVPRHGAAVAVEERGWPLRAPDGSTSGAVLVLREVSRRRQAEAALCEREEYFRFLAEMVPAMVWTARPDGANDYANQRWYEYSGLTPERSEGFGWTAAVHPDDRPRSLDLWQGALETGEAGEAEVRLRRRDGAYRWFLLRAAPLRDERGVCKRFGISTDIDDRKRAEHALRESEERFRRIVETSAEGIWVIDAESRTTYVNRRMAEMLGCAAADMLGRYPSDFLFPEDLEAARQQFRLKRQGDSQPFDFRLRRQDGSALWVRVANSPMYQEDGQFVGALGMFSDITDRKRMEEALQEADRHKDRFLATLAHELRSPLASVRSAAHILGMKGPPEPDVVRARAVIDRQVEQMARLVDDLLDVSRISRGQVGLRKERAELAAVLTRAVETSRPLLDAGRHELSVSLPPEPVWLEVDPGRLAQVFSNLLNNAAKYTAAGGHIWLSADREGADVVARVRDTGIGITPELLPRIFDPFVQSDRAPAHAQGGLGLGLALVKTLIELHGGSVRASSAGPGQGSEFVVRLPGCPT
jgi:PAS domain S-box-containing protein